MEQLAAVMGADKTGWVKVNNAGSWTPWFSLGGGLLDDPFVLSSGGGRWDLFVLGSDHAAWTQTNTGSGWSGWISLGGGLVSRPVASASQNGRIDLFAQANDRAIWLRSRVNGNWSTWKSLLGCTTSPPAAVVSGPSTFVFARGCDDAVWSGTLTGDAWSGWTSRGGSASSDITAVSTSSGDIFVFYIDAAHAANVLKMTAAGAWGAWQTLGPNVVGKYVSPLAKPNGDVAIFGLGSDEKVWTKSLNASTGQWSSWLPVQLYNFNTMTAPSFVQPPRATIDNAANILLTAQSADGDLWEARTVYGEWNIWIPSE
jgi:hypothetical protein